MPMPAYMRRYTLRILGFGLLYATIWGFLENFDLVTHVPGYHVTVLWFAMIGVGGAIARWRA